MPKFSPTAGRKKSERTQVKEYHEEIKLHQDKVANELNRLMTEIAALRSETKEYQLNASKQRREKFNAIKEMCSEIKKDANVNIQILAKLEECRKLFEKR